MPKKYKKYQIHELNNLLTRLRWEKQVEDSKLTAFKQGKKQIVLNKAFNTITLLLNSRTWRHFNAKIPKSPLKVFLNLQTQWGGSKPGKRRPYKPFTERKSKSIPVSVTLREYNKIKQRAKENRCSMSQLLRKRIFPI